MEREWWCGEVVGVVVGQMVCLCVCGKRGELWGVDELDMMYERCEAM